MPIAEATVRIQASPHAVGDVLRDPRLAPSWTAGLEKLEVLEGSPGEAGCVGAAHYAEHGRQTTLTDRLVEAVPDRYYRSELTGAGIRATVVTKLTPVRGGTDVTVRWSGAGTNPLTRLVLCLSGPRLATRMLADLNALGRVVEGRETGGRSGTRAGGQPPRPASARGTARKGTAAPRV